MLFECVVIEAHFGFVGIRINNFFSEHFLKSLGDDCDQEIE